MDMNQHITKGIKNRILKYYGTAIIFCVPFFASSQTNNLHIVDSRDVATAPGDYRQALKGSFKLGTVMGISNGEYYYSLLGLRGWVDDSGGSAHELAFSNNSVLYRTGFESSGWSSWRRILIEDKNGFVGIGTNTPLAKLSVNGNILANEIKIKTNIEVPDYVFDPTYQLPKLSTIEDYVKTHRHLPEIPSAAEIQKDGVDLTQMNLTLLKKVEELTLHAIDNEKKRKELEDKVLQLEKIVLNKK